MLSVNDDDTSALEEGLISTVSGADASPLKKELLGKCVFRVRSASNPRDVSHEFILYNNRLQCVTDVDLSLPVRNIVGCHLIKSENTNEGLKIIAYVVRPRKGPCMGKKNDQLVRTQLELVSASQSTTCRWYSTLKWLIYLDDGQVPVSMNSIPELPADFGSEADFPLPPQRRLLVFLNPNSGTGVAERVWNHVSKPVIVDDAECKVQLVVTNKQYHAKEYVESCSDLVASYDGILIVSGDGLFYEVLQGIMNRNDWAVCVQKLTLGIIPAGTGNGLATSIAHGCSLPNTSLSLSFISSKSWRKCMDIQAVDIIGTDTVQRVYSFLSMEWGVNSYLDIDSERARCLGSFRFTLWGLLGTVIKRSYKGTLAYVPVDRGSEIMNGVEGNKGRTAKKLELPKPLSYWEVHSDFHANAPVGAPPVTSLLPDPTKQVPNNWKVISDDDFQTMLTVNIPWISSDACPAPDTRIDDGYIQMMYLRKNGRINLLRYLIALEGGGVQEQEFVEQVPTRAFRLQPNDQNLEGKRYIAIDGEEIEYTSIQVENLGRFLNIMSA